LLTADLVRARRKGDELKLVALDDKTRADAIELAGTLLALAAAHVGSTREELDEACDAVTGKRRDRALVDGLRKLVEDRCLLEVDADVAPDELRREVFVAATAARRALLPGATFDRRAVLAAIAEARGISIDDVERGLYADLRGAHVLTSVEAISAERLVEQYELGQAQAVLLRAVRVVVDVACASAGAYRSLFRRLKFLRLLYSIHATEAGYRIEIDGPYSLFESVTRYGLALALALPAIRECDRWSLVADLRWGPERRALTFKLAGARTVDDAAVASLPDDVAALARAIALQDTPWSVTPADALIDLPGVGVCVPDLALAHRDTGEVIYLEVLGYWSRAAVWKRVELIERGLAAKIVFCVGKHLRVSEDVLADDVPGALYVYKRTLSARAVLERVEALAATRA